MYEMTLEGLLRLGNSYYGQNEAKEKFILGYLNYKDEGIQQLALTL